MQNFISKAAVGFLLSLASLFGYHQNLGTIVNPTQISTSTIAAAGGVVASSSLASGTIPVAIASNTLVNSIILQSGQCVSISGSATSTICADGSLSTVGGQLKAGSSTFATTTVNGGLTVNVSSSWVNVPYNTPAQTQGYQLGLGDFSGYFWQNYGNTNDVMWLSTNFFKNNAGTNQVQAGSFGTTYIKQGIKAVNNANGIALGTGKGNGNVPTDSLVVDDNGKVGIGTSVPSSTLHVASISTSTPIVQVSSGTATYFLIASSGMTSILGTSTVAIGGASLALDACTSTITTVPLVLSSTTDVVNTQAQIFLNPALFGVISTITSSTATTSQITTQLCDILVAGSTPTSTKFNLTFDRMTGL